jgi:hypothetical protein
MGRNHENDDSYHRLNKRVVSSRDRRKGTERRIGKEEEEKGRREGKGEGEGKEERKRQGSTRAQVRIRN